MTPPGPCRGDPVPTPGLAITRRSLHGVAELVLAGPEHRRTGEIALRVTAHGFATVADPPLSTTAVHLLSGERAVALDGATCTALAEAAGVEPGPPEGLYHEGSG